LKQRLNLETVLDEQSPTRGNVDYGDSHIRDDFSVNSDESEGTVDDNCLDLRIVEANLNQETIENFLVSNASGRRGGQIDTLVSVDFYDHKLQTTQLASGYRPQYRSQISFKNKMDSYYISQIQKEKVKLEVYMNVPGGRGTVKLGACETLLSELVHKESLVADMVAQKTSVVEKNLFIIADSGITGGMG
jgi:hypothetical protein